MNRIGKESFSGKSIIVYSNIQCAIIGLPFMRGRLHGFIQPNRLGIIYLTGNTPLQSINVKEYRTFSGGRIVKN